MNTWEVTNIEKDNSLNTLYRYIDTSIFLLSLLHLLSSRPACLIKLKGLDWLKDQSVPGAHTGVAFWTPTGICQDSLLSCWLFTNCTETFLSFYYWSSLYIFQQIFITHTEQTRELHTDGWMDVTGGIPGYHYFSVAVILQSKEHRLACWDLLTLYVALLNWISFFFLVFFSYLHFNNSIHILQPSGR